MFSLESNNEDMEGEQESSAISETVSSISDSNKQPTEPPNEGSIEECRSLNCCGGQAFSTKDWFCCN